MKVLIATEKPFAPVAVKGIKDILDEASVDLELLEKYTEKKQLLEAVATANALIVRSDIIDEEVMQAAPELKIIVRAGAGYDNIDLEAATRHGIIVENTPGQNANAVAELVIGMLIYTIRNRFNGTSGTLQQTRVEIEHITRVSLTSGWTAENQRYLTVSHSLLTQVIVYDES